MGKTGKDTIVGLQPGGAGTWQTAVAPTANDGFLPISIDPIILQGDPVADEAIGMVDIENMDMIKHEANPTIVWHLRWNGMHWGLLTNFLGDDTKTGAGPTYTHTMNWQTSSSLVQCTMALEINAADILEWPSLKVTGIALEPDSEGFWQATANTIGTTIQVAGDATTSGANIDAITYTTKVQRMRYKGNKFRMNAQAGGALASPTDDQTVSDFTINMTRPYVQDEPLVGVTTGAEKQTGEPVQDGHAELIVSFNEVEYASIANFDELKDQTQQKGDLVMSETIGSDAHTSTFEFGAMNPIPASVALEKGGRVPHQRNFRLLKPSSTPTGLSTANPIHYILVNTQNLTYETGA